MADDLNTPAPKRRATSARKPASAKAALSAQPTSMETTAMTDNIIPETAATDHRSQAKSRFNAAVQEAKAGARELKAEASERAAVYRDQAGQRSQDLMADAKAYGEEARVKGKELATQGKGKVSEGLTALGQVVADNAHVVDEKLGARYGDYARTASRSLQDAGARLDQKSVEELGEDARAFVRKSPGTAVGIAAVVGFLLSRLFTSPRR